MATSEQRGVVNLALVGFMGTGKSTAGRQVADLLQFRFVDTDELIEERAGKSISRIFDEEGESVFRDWEREVVEELGREEGLVISAGGGLGANAENLAKLKRHALVVCLWASPETIYSRVRHQRHRPLLQDADPLMRIRQLLESREGVYRQADALVNTEMRPMKEVVQQVMREFHLARKPAAS